MERAREVDALRRRCVLRMRQETLWRAFSFWDKFFQGSRAKRARDARVAAFCTRRRHVDLRTVWHGWVNLVSENLRHERLVARALHRMQRRRISVSFELLDAYRLRRTEAKTKMKRLVLSKMKALVKIGFDAMRDNSTHSATLSAKIRLAIVHHSRKTAFVAFRQWATHCQRFARARHLRRHILNRISDYLLYSSFVAWARLCRQRGERRAQSNRASNIIARMV